MVSVGSGWVFGGLSGSGWCFGGLGVPPIPVSFPTPPAGKRPRKGLATAKQRLGRILKIHRNGKLLL